jgi:hypothetical protein
MSSHREAPEISKDPVADSTDLYAFVSPDKPDTVTIIANYLPLQAPSGGPNFFEFGDDVLYEIHIDNNGDAKADLTYQFRFRTEITNDRTFLYNTGPIETLDDKDWNRKQFYTVTCVDGNGKGTIVGKDIPCPPCNIGPSSTPDYAKLAKDAVYKLESGARVFAGQRADGFFVDLGAIFDLGTLRPFQNLHLTGKNIFDAPGDGVNTLDKTNVHSIALQLPLSSVTQGGKKYKYTESQATIGVWTTASRRQVRVLHGKNGDDLDLGPTVQVSRLGNPLFNEVIVPMAQKDKFNALEPTEDKQFAEFVAQPELAGLLPVLYPDVFPNLEKLVADKTDRADLLAILLTGIPEGIIDGFTNFTGETQADMLRLNTAIPPTAKPNAFGLVAGDAAGWPNGRRPEDDVVGIALRAVAGATFPLIDKDFTPDEATGLLEQGITAKDVSAGFLGHFPYLGLPYDGFNNPS